MSGGEPETLFRRSFPCLQHKQPVHQSLRSLIDYSTYVADMTEGGSHQPPPFNRWSRLGECCRDFGLTACKAAMLSKDGVGILLGFLDHIGDRLNEI